MNKLHIIIPACLLLALCCCKGRHADGTPTGETVEVEIEAIEQAPAQAPGAATALPTDSLPLPAADTAAQTNPETNL